MRIRLATLAAFAVLACTSFRAEAIFRAYVASTGSDANACTLPAPCRLLPAAIAAADDGGEVWMLDSANYNAGPVTIAKSISILAVPGAVGSVVASGGHAITINAPSARVGLRNLVFRNFNLGQSGVVLTNGLQLAVEECQFVGLPQHGIHAPTGARVVVRNTTFRDTGNTAVLLDGGVDATIENVHVVNATTGILVANVSKATITDSLVANTVAGIQVETVFSNTTNATIERTTIRNASSFGVHARGGIGLGSRANLVLRGSTISRADVGVFVSTEHASSSAFATLEGNVIVHNRIGAQTNGPGPTTLSSVGNNTFAFNSQVDTTVAPGAQSPQ